MKRIIVIISENENKKLEYLSENKNIQQICYEVVNKVERLLYELGRESND